MVNWGTSSEVQTELPFRFPVELEERGQVVIEIKGPRGSVNTLMAKEEEAGKYEYTWDGKGAGMWRNKEVEEGEYVAHVNAGRLFRKHRLILKWPERVFLSVLKEKLWLREGGELKGITVERLRDYIEERKRENPDRDMAIWFRGAEGDRLVAEIERVGREAGVQVVRERGVVDEVFLRWVQERNEELFQRGLHRASTLVHVGEGGRFLYPIDVTDLEELEGYLRGLDRGTGVLIRAYSERENGMVEQVRLVVEKVGGKVSEVRYDSHIEVRVEPEGWLSVRDVEMESEREEPMIKKVRKIVEDAGHEVSRIHYSNHIEVRIDARGEMFVRGVKMGLDGLEEVLKRKKVKGAEEPVLVVSGHLEHEELIEQIRNVAKENGVQVRGLRIQAAPEETRIDTVGIDDARAERIREIEEEFIRVQQQLKALRDGATTLTVSADGKMALGNSAGGKLEVDMEDLGSVLSAWISERGEQGRLLVKGVPETKHTSVHRPGWIGSF